METVIFSELNHSSSSICSARLNKQAIAERRKEGRKPVQPSPRKTVPAPPSSPSPHPPSPAPKRERIPTEILSPSSGLPLTPRTRSWALVRACNRFLARSHLPPTRAHSHTHTRARWQNGTSQSAGLTHQPHDQRLELKKGESVYSLSWVQSVSWAARS